MTEAVQHKRGLAEAFSGLSVSAKRRIAGAAGGVAAVVAAAAIVLTTITAAAAAQSLLVKDASYPEGTTVIADASTANSFRTYPTADAYNTTNYAGRLWADKTVYAPADGDKLGSTVLLDLVDENNDLDPDDNGAVEPGKYEVDKTDSGTFMTCMSLLSSSLQTELYEPVPLDIVLVLDISGSMNTMNGYSGPLAEAKTDVSPNDPNDHNTNLHDNGGNNGGKHLYVIREVVDEKEVYYQIRAVAVDNATGDTYYYNVDGHPGQRFYFTNRSDLDGKLYGDGSNPNYKYALLYERDAEPSRMTEVKTATKEFLETIAQNNSSLAELGYSTDSMSRVAMVTFSNAANNMIAEGNFANNTTRVVTAFTTYSTEGSASVSGTAKVTYGTDIVNKYTAQGGTAANSGLQRAKDLFDGAITLSSSYRSRVGTLDGVLTTGNNKVYGKRDNAKQVVIFFTDGNPKTGGSAAPNDFEGKCAIDTIGVAERLKDDGVYIYSVAMIPGADSSRLDRNVDIYLNAVSSNYRVEDGGVSNGGSKGVSGFDSPASNSWTVNLNKFDGSDLGYYMVVGGDKSVSQAFAEIAADISTGGGEDTISTGRDGNTGVTITDYLGDYMEFKGIDGILYGVKAEDTKFYAPGTQGAYHEQAQAQRDDRSATESVYTMSASVPSALLKPAEGKETVNLNSITIQVTRSTDPKTGDTVTILVPPELIPSLRYNVSQQLDANGSVRTTATLTEADPLRIYYSVGPKATTLSNVISKLESQALSDPSAVNESDKQTVAYSTFAEDAAYDGRGNMYPLYNNLVPTANNPAYNAENTTGDNPAAGTTRVDMTLSTSNPFYFYADEPLWILASTGGYRRATHTDYADENAVFYVRERTFSLPAEGETYGTETTEAKVWTGAKELRDDGYVYIKVGTAKTEAEHLTNMALSKGDGNYTNTAENYLVSVFDGQTMDENNNYTAVIYLGNNGELDIPVYGTLAVTKDFTVDSGYSLPANATASFTLTLKDENGLTLDGDYPAIIRNEQGYPVDHETHAIVNTAEAALFKLGDNDTFTLRDGETLRITGLPHNSTYLVTEDAAQGYAATVTNNDGSESVFTRDQGGYTGPIPSSQGGGE